MKVGKRTQVWHPEKSLLLDCNIGEDCTIHAMVWIGNNVIIGDRVKIQAFCFIPEGVVIKDDVFLGPRVTFTNDKHPPSNQWLPTIVEEGASIGAGAIILPGLRIGKCARIGAGSVVTRDVPPCSTVYGNPARMAP